MNYIFLDRKKLEEFLEWRDLARGLLCQYEENIEIIISKIAVIQTRPFDSAYAPLKEDSFTLTPVENLHLV